MAYYPPLAPVAAIVGIYANDDVVRALAVSPRVAFNRSLAEAGRALVFKFDKSRVDLAREFRAAPFGEHSPDLQYLLNILRAPRPGAFHVLLIDRPGERWTLGMMEPGRAPARTNVVFTSLAEAEWHIFRERWGAMAGEECPVS